MWELDCDESWAPKNWCFWTVVLEKTLESPLDCKEIQPVHPKGNQSWIFIRRSDAEAETPILGHLMQRTDSLEKTLMLGKTKGRRRGWRGWDGWMASATQWTWVWASSRSWWWTGKPGVLQSMGLQRVRYDWATELNIWGLVFEYRVDSLKLLFSCSFVSNFFRPHGLQHARPPCPSLTHGVDPNSCSLSQWCHPTISSSVIPFSSCLQSFPASGSFKMSQFFASGGQSIRISASTSVLLMNTQD